MWANSWNICSRGVSTALSGFSKVVAANESMLINTMNSTSCTSFLIPIRYRYFDPEKVTFRHWGYKDQYSLRGPLPRIPRESIKRLPGRVYAPTNSWTEEKALFGQNDYIDILGSPDIHPVRIAYGVPHWLKGFSGNEFQMLLRKRKFFGLRIKSSNPDAWNDLRKRIGYLYKTLNRKRRYHFKEYH